MATLEQFATSMRTLGQRVADLGPAGQRLVAGEILRLVVFGTPVGNKNIWLEPHKARVGYVGGRARANWFVGVGSAPADVTDTVDNSGNGVIAAGQATIASAVPGSEIHIVNNLPYIVPLNQGHSHQAPSGWIDVAIKQGLNAMTDSFVRDALSAGRATP